MDRYIDEAGPVNGQVDPVEIELPRFLPPRRKQAVSKPRAISRLRSGRRSARVSVANANSCRPTARG
jgi:hypothetical protein